MNSRRRPAALAGPLLLIGLLAPLFPSRGLAQEPGAGVATPAAVTRGALAPSQYIPYDPAFAEVECPFIVPWTEEISCGTLTVPENRLDPQSGTIDIFVTILTSQGRPEADPIILLPGGPGEAASPSRRVFYGLPFRDHRDVILMDPRGVGLSTPSLDCPELQGLAPNSDAAVDAFRTCHSRLQAEGRDFAGYNTGEMAEDVADLARVLGVGSLNLYGAGYGARVAAVLADRYPQLVRSMVLDGPIPVAANMMLEEPLNVYGVLRRIAADCASDIQCNAAYPALEPRLIEVIDRYNRRPAPAETGYGSGNDMLRLILDTLSHGGRMLPAFITALFEGDFAAACAALPPAGGCSPALTAAGPGRPPSEDPRLGEETDDTAPWRTLFADPDAPAGLDAELVTWLMQTLGYSTPEELFNYLPTLDADEVEGLRAQLPADTIDLFGEGLYASVLCAEEAPFYSAADVGLIAGRIPRQFGAIPIERAAALDAICTFWKTPALSAAAKVMQANTTPTLVVAGTHDPETPPAWARRMASALEASTVLLFPGYGHGLLSSSDACVQDTLQLFFEQPNIEPRHDCLDQLEVTFLLPSRE